MGEPCNSPDNLFILTYLWDSDMRMDDPIPTFSYLMEQLAQRHPELAYVHFVEPRVSGDNEVGHAHEVGTPKVRWSQ